MLFRVVFIPNICTITVYCKTDSCKIMVAISKGHIRSILVNGMLY